MSIKSSNTKRKTGTTTLSALLITMPLPSQLPQMEPAIATCHDLGMSVVAEGVENLEQLEFIKKHKCLEYQGFLFSKPLPADVFHDLLCEKKINRFLFR